MDSNNTLVIGFWWDWGRCFLVAISITLLYHINRKDYKFNNFGMNLALVYLLVGSLTNYILGRIVSTFGVQ